MNRIRRKSRGLGPLGIILIIICAVVATTAGISHAMLKNKQLQVLREIEKTQGRIGDMELDIATEEMRTSAMMDRYELRSAIESIQSELTPISTAQLEVIDLAEGQKLVSNTPHFQ